MRTALLALAMMIGLTSIGCSTAPASQSDRQALVYEAKAALRRLERVNPDLYGLYDKKSVAVASFPTVGKGAVGVGGAYGKGVLFEGGGLSGYCDLTQASIGFQLGGQAYSEIIFFKDNASLRDFKAGRTEFSAAVSAVAITADASSTANFDNGVAVFTINGKGLMYEASLGGQGFDFVPVGAVD